MQTIGFIGLGIMGKPMAINLRRAGFALHFYARRPETIAELTNLGAIAHESPKDLAEHCQVIITMLPATADVEEVLLGRLGVIHSAKANTTIIDMSTISAATTKRLAKQLAAKQLKFLDAPVSGGEQGAIAASLSIMVGGDTETFNHVLPVLQALGKNVIHVGEQGAGQTTKACNQIVIAQTIVAVSDAIRLAEAYGIDPNKVRDALMGGFASSRVLEIHGKRMLDEEYTTGYKAALHRKDMHLALDQAHLAHLDLPAARHAMKCLDRLVSKGHQELDSAAIHLVNEDHVHHGEK